MRRLFFVWATLCCCVSVWGVSHIVIDDPSTWTADELTPYIGQVVVFDSPLVVTSVSSSLTVSPRRNFAETNQARPRTEEYDNIVRLNKSGNMLLYGTPSSHRTGENIVGLQVVVLSKTELQWQGGRFEGNTRADLMRGPDMSVIDPLGERNLLVCGMNLEYYLSCQFDPKSSMGPANYEQHVRQRTKVISALQAINADIYGFVEIQQGDSAMREIALYLNKVMPGRKYTYVASGTTPSGTYTQSCFVYDANKVETQGSRIDVSSGVVNRKRMQIFREKSTGETFIYSINHYKAKSGSGAAGQDADQGDGQGQFNHTRTLESQAVVDKYNVLRQQAKDSDILIMGDLNAYGMEDPIYYLTSTGQMTDLHRYFHADSSYSYTFRGQAGYLDHALCSASMLPQITGMAAFHINSDEDDRYTYDKSTGDLTMFRCSDHDPVLVGIKLDKTMRLKDVDINGIEILRDYEDIIIRNAMMHNTPAHYVLYTPFGIVVEQGKITSNAHVVNRPHDSGIYLLTVYANGATRQFKVMIR